MRFGVKDSVVIGDRYLCINIHNNEYMTTTYNCCIITDVSRYGFIMNCLNLVYIVNTSTPEGFECYDNISKNVEHNIMAGEMGFSMIYNLHNVFISWDSCHLASFVDY